ncbi:MAG: hypothetical protein ACOX3Q_03440 [Clostridia bacterium]|jgi:hypothetical protein|nr:hypothetical protein [Clostridiaceae bacterium]
MIPTVDFYGHKITRLMIGSNPFTGHSYIESKHSGEEMMDYYTAENCVRTLFEAESLGINTFMTSADPFIFRVIRQYKNEGGKMNIMFQSYPAMDLAVNLRMMLKCEPVAIYHQGTNTDYLFEQGQIDTIRQNIKTIKSSGVITGLGTHVPETLLQAEEEDWGADFYSACLYNARRQNRGEQSGFITGKTKAHLVFYPEDRFIMFDAIKKVSKPVIAFKTFAGGQIFLGKAPEEIPAIAEQYLKETYENIKPIDMVMIGVFQKYKNELKENVEIAKKIFSEIK